jgi:hypothetical protein
MGRAIWLRGTVLLACVGAWSCSEAPPVSDPPASSDPEAIIGGASTDDPKYAAVGALGWAFPGYGVVHVFCSGTLVAPQAIVTARHCTGSIDEGNAIGVVPVFIFGSDAYASTTMVPITSYVNAPPSPQPAGGLLLDGGRDVSVAQLENPVTDVVPAKLGQFDDSFIGEPFDIAGFGINDVTFASGLKFSGTVTARATHGRWYDLLFNGDYDAYLDWYFTDSAAALPSLEEAKEWWKIYRLENKYELLAGGLPGESIGCFGDSGGPLLRGTSASDLTTYGVSFATEATFSTVCGLGGAYAVFNQTMLEFVESAL